MDSRILAGIMLLTLIAGCTQTQPDTVKSSDGVASLKIPQEALPQGTTLSDVSISQIPKEQMEIEIEDAELIGYKLEPDGLEFAQPILLEFEVEKTGEETGIPILFHKSKDEIDIINMTYTIDENTTKISANITHFSDVYYIPPARDPKEGEVSRSYYKISRSTLDKIERFVGQEFTVSLTYRKLRDEISIKNEDGTTTFQIVPNSEWLKGNFHAYWGNMLVTNAMTGKTGMMDPIITPINVKAPPLSRFTSDTYAINQKFTCMRPGHETFSYESTIYWTDSIEGIRGTKQKSAKVKFVWSVTCKAIEVSCAGNTENPVGYQTDPEYCKDDCPKEKYCDTQSCTCKDKQVMLCNNPDNKVPLLDAVARSRLYCKDNCDAGEVCNQNTCECEEIVPEIGCKENSWTGEYETGDKFICKDDCEQGLVCDVVSCQCVSQEEKEKIESKKGEDIIEGECTIDPFEYGEIKVLEKAGTGDWEVAGDGYEAGMLDFTWTLKHTNPQQSAAGIGVNYQVKKDGIIKATQWVRSDEEGIVRVTYPVWEKGTYKVSIVDFEEFGSYCGDGDTITISVG